MDRSIHWETADHGILLRHNYTDRRDLFNFTVNNVYIPSKNNSDQKPLMSNLNTFDFGYNWHNKTANNNTLKFVINGKGTQNQNTIKVDTTRCLILRDCFGDAGDDGPLNEDTIYRWSDADFWKVQVYNEERVPQDGDDLILKSPWWIKLDQDSPVLGKLEVRGRLEFDSTKDITLKAKSIWLRGGEIRIGTSTARYEKNALIELQGGKFDEVLSFSNTVEAGNKILASNGNITMYGKDLGGQTLGRLHASAAAGDTSITVAGQMTNWKVGDEIGLAPTGLAYNTAEQRTIATIDSSVTNTVITFTPALEHAHYGSADSTKYEIHGVDTRGEVAMLSRNIKIKGTGTDNWGCQVLVHDLLEVDQTTRKTRTFMDHVEMAQCSQQDTHKANLRFEGVSLYEEHKVTNCAFHSGIGRGLQLTDAHNVTIDGNVFFGAKRFGVNIEASSKLKIDNNYIIGVTERDFKIIDHQIDEEAGMFVCVYSSCTDLQIRHNTVAGAKLGGYYIPGLACADRTG